VRVFVALDIPEEVRAAIGKLIARLRTSCRAARWVRIEGVHLTLKFIGEVQPEKIEPIKASLARIRYPDAIELKFRNVGFFPNERRPRVFWAGIEAGPELGSLAIAVETSLEPLGIAKEQRAFSPHLTLARFETDRGAGPAFALDTLTKAISEAGPFEFGAGIANEFHLYQSILKSGGAEYTRLATFRFKGDESQ
jgi:RNA 2',3'-cyclic 3'-phosphodiesterase